MQIVVMGQISNFKTDPLYLFVCFHSIRVTSQNVINDSTSPPPSNVSRQINVKHFPSSYFSHHVAVSTKKIKKKNIHEPIVLWIDKKSLVYLTQICKCSMFVSQMNEKFVLKIVEKRKSWQGNFWKIVRKSFRVPFHFCLTFPFVIQLSNYFFFLVPVVFCSCGY